jgi:mannobiose 2-epimerase
MDEKLIELRNELRQELESILTFWAEKMPDKVHGGFLGAMDHHGLIKHDAPKGAVLNARILWTFATAANLSKSKHWASIANETYQYFIKYFFDSTYGGVYWSISYNGKPLDTKKQVYAQAFSMYALAAYYGLTQKREALDGAIELFRCIERYSYDEKYSGYSEAFTREWKTIDDLRLSAKDANEKKTMNTHLHVLEGYTLLYKYWPDALLRERIVELLIVFRDKILQKETHTQGLFFNEYWERKDTLISYGHDIEASWLLQEAADVIRDVIWIKWAKENAVKLANAATKGIDSDGGMWHEFDSATMHLVKEKHWWPQAEAMVGYYNAWQCTGKQEYLEQVYSSWAFIKKYLVDSNLGEWKWGVKEDYRVMEHEDFAGFWKCPYHNGRACMEILHRLK